MKITTEGRKTSTWRADSTPVQEGTPGGVAEAGTILKFIAESSFVTEGDGAPHPFDTASMAFGIAIGIQVVTDAMKTAPEAA